MKLLAAVAIGLAVFGLVAALGITFFVPRAD